MLLFDHRSYSTRSLFYAHIFIILGILLFTIGLEFYADHHHQALGQNLFMASLILFYPGLFALSAYNHKLYRIHKRLVAFYLVTFILGLGAIFVLKDNLIAIGIILNLLNYLFARINFQFRKNQRERNQVPHPDPTQNLRDFS